MISRVLEIIFKVVLPVSYICMKVLGIFMDFVLAVAITEIKDAANLKSLNLTNIDLTQVNEAIDLNAIAAKESAQEKFFKVTHSTYMFELDTSSLAPSRLNLKIFISGWEHISPMRSGIERVLRQILIIIWARHG